MILFSGPVSNDYHQIYLCDSSLPALPDDYSEDAIARRVVTGPDAMVIHVEREMPVPVEVLLHEARPSLDLAPFDHVAEAGLTAASGMLVLAGLLDDPKTAPHLAVPAPRLGAIITFAGLGTLNWNGLEGEDRYAVHLWPDQNARTDVLVLKRFSTS